MEIVYCNESCCSLFRRTHRALARYIDGQQPIENGILTTITALHIVIRMDPSRYVQASITLASTTAKPCPLQPLSIQHPLVLHAS